MLSGSGTIICMLSGSGSVRIGMGMGTALPPPPPPVAISCCISSSGAVTLYVTRLLCTLAPCGSVAVKVTLVIPPAKGMSVRSCPLKVMLSIVGSFMVTS